MTSNRYQSSERDIYLEAPEMDDPIAVAVFLDSSCEGGVKLHARIRKLLNVSPRAELFEPDPLIREVIERGVASESE
ncbi:MAG: hypothetical protein P1U89_05790 [Verrucomicrobiales bacterium]|nr:hypothetical protein [Verrucomicrobiales bacterium]